MKEFSFEQLIDQHTDFTLAMFTDATHLSSLIKLAGDNYEGEVLEVGMAITGGLPKDVIAEEYIDCIMCLLDSAARSGIRSYELRRAFELKLAKNRARTWVKNPDNTYSHTKPTNHI